MYTPCTMLGMASSGMQFVSSWKSTNWHKTKRVAEGGGHRLITHSDLIAYFSSFGTSSSPHVLYTTPHMSTCVFMTQISSQNRDMWSTYQPCVFPACSQGYTDRPMYWTESCEQEARNTKQLYTILSVIRWALVCKAGHFNDSVEANKYSCSPHLSSVRHSDRRASTPPQYPHSSLMTMLMTIADSNL